MYGSRQIDSKFHMEKESRNNRQEISEIKE